MTNALPGFFSFGPHLVGHVGKTDEFNVFFALVVFPFVVWKF